MPIMRLLEKNMSRRREEIAKVVEHNRHSLSYLVSQIALKQKKRSERKRKAASDEDNIDSSQSDNENEMDALFQDSDSGEELAELY